MEADAGVRAAIVAFDRDHEHLHFEFAFDELRNVVSLRYHDCDLVDLEARFGEENLQRLYFHIGAFEVNKLASLAPSTISFGPFARFVTAPFATFWTQVVHHVWAQWRFENDRPDTGPPRIVDEEAPAATPLTVEGGVCDHLVFCGGGKDSLVAARLLERAGATYESFVYASSIYGDLDNQHTLIDGLLAHLHPRAVRRLDLVDDFPTDAMRMRASADGITSFTAAETPASIFEALPLVLQHGTRRLVLGHERSADVGNLVWDRTGEEVNHQWGKSTACEALLATYVREHLVAEVELFSILKPINDVVIFSLLADEDPAAVAATHSCNVAKPWCRRCPKCVYVWLGYLAHLDAEIVTSMFGEDLFAVEDNRQHLEMLAGMGAHTPFECVGQVEETLLAFELCRAKGLRGPLLYDLPRIDHVELESIIDRFTQVDATYVGLPTDLRTPVLSAQRAAAAHSATAMRDQTRSFRSADR